jgi:hypothetical protein
MQIETKNAVSLFFPTPSFCQIYSEAVANALDANATEIEIRIEINSFNEPESLKLTTTDNGDGFTNESFERFSRLLNPQDAYHKGLGRLVFLKYFEHVDVESRFSTWRRTFRFWNDFDGKSKIEDCNVSAKRNETRLSFRQFAGNRLKSYEDLKPRSVRDRLVLELLPRLYEMKKDGKKLTLKIDLYVQQGNPAQDFLSDTQIFTLEALPQLTEIRIQEGTVDLLSEITMAYSIRKEFGRNSIVTAACVDNRTIPLPLIPDDGIPSNHVVVFLFYSNFFNGKADSSRQKLDLKDDATEKALFHTLRRYVAKAISDEIPTVRERNHRTKSQLVDHFPHLLGYFEEETVGLINKDEALEIAQKRFFRDQKEILESERLDDAKFIKSLEVSSRTLTEYVLYRNLIIKKLREINPNQAETEIHQLVVPRFKEFKGSELVRGIYSNNAWLLDDKFMTFSTILSEARMDKLIKQITSSERVDKDETRPDISMIFSNDPDKAEKVDVVIVEMKKHTDDEMENHYAVVQLLQRAEKLVKHCPNIQRMWYYAVLHINSEFATRLGQMGYSPLFSKGQVFYRENSTKAPDGTIVPTPTFVVSFDAVISDAECRNGTFLALLRDGMKRFTSEREAEVSLETNQIKFVSTSGSNPN